MKFSRTKPTEPGWYIAKFSFWYDLIKIDYKTTKDWSDREETDLWQFNGAQTHFTRWDCEWSEKIDLPSLAIT